MQTWLEKYHSLMQGMLFTGGYLTPAAVADVSYVIGGYSDTYLVAGDDDDDAKNIHSANPWRGDLRLLMGRATSIGGNGRP